MSKWRSHKEIEHLKKQKPPLCKCRCGQPVKWHYTLNRWNKYLFGHSARKKDYHGRINTKQPLCKCGCGQPVKWQEEKNKWNKYLNGHHNKGKKMKKEQRRKLSTSQGGNGILKEEKKSTLCNCGCKKQTKPGNKYISGHVNLDKRGKLNPYWKGGRKAAIKRCCQKKRKNLSDTYVKGLLCKNSNLNFSDIPQELVELQRTKTKLHRIIKKGA